MSRSQRLLVIDDEPGVGEFIRDATERMSIPCVVTSDTEEFFRQLTPETTLILVDLVMPATDGIELLRMLAQRACRKPIVLMSGLGKRVIESAEHLAGSLGLDVVGHLQKPFRLAELETLLRKQMEDGEPREQRPAAKPVVTDEELRKAIEEDQFEVHYQPQIDLKSNAVVGIEALVRWRHAEHGLIFPDEFIGRLEGLGLIDQLGWIVARQSLGEMGRAVSSGGEQPVLSLNVSVFSLYDLGYPDAFLVKLKKSGIDPRQVMLEITESGLINELSNTLDVLTRLRMKEVQLSIDDFGTGYAMMQQLRLIPATELKIDRSFVQRMLVCDSDRVMVQKTIEMGHELGMRVVAEGVETAEQMVYLRENGCDVGQGYWFSRPVPMDELVMWIRKREEAARSGAGTVTAS